MDLIRSVKHAENRLGGRKPNQGKGKSVQKNIRHEPADEKDAAAAADRASAEWDAMLGLMVDISA